MPDARRSGVRCRDAQSADSQRADVVFTGRRAYSAGWGLPRALGIAVRDGAIVAVAPDAYTAGSAVSNGRGDDTGRLEAGFAADLVVPDDDPFALPPECLAHVRVGQTWVNGACLFGA
jgi:predicted amidohydrolase YtcJ